MDRLIEFVNPNPHNVQLVGPDRKSIVVPAHQKVILSEWFLERYVPKYLQVVKAVGTNDKPVAKLERALLTHAKAVKPTGFISAAPTPGMEQLIAQPLPSVSPISSSSSRARREALEKLTMQRPNQVIETARAVPSKPNNKQITRHSRVRNKPERPIGRTRSAGADTAFSQVQSENKWSISNNIGVGILSYNRLSSLQRLIASIRANTDLSRVTVFISDESTDPSVSDWLNAQSDLVVLTNQPRLGVAGNSNRLLRCLSRFKYCYLFNDDAEVLQPGWTDFYIEAANETSMHHFCFRQVGLLGATHGNITKSNKYSVSTIANKPHGAVMFYTNDVFRRIGYFDEQFGLYGMEHVDWSNRAGLSGIQPSGFHDVLGSDRFYKIHNEPSTVVDKLNILNEARAKYAIFAAEISRVYVSASPATIVPAASVIIPVRNTDRDGAIEAVVNSMRSQLFPVIELMVVEQDSEVRTAIDKFRPVSYNLAQSVTADQPFTKAMAFNLGVARAVHNNIILHDADMLAPRNYVQKVAERLSSFEGLHIGKSVVYLSRMSSASLIADCHVLPGAECERVVDYFEGGSLACRRSTYINIGGFNESYVGYGVEDCDFFERLKHCTKFDNERIIPLIHLWHSRTGGWEQHHERNKQLKNDINNQFGITDKVVIASASDISGLKAYSNALSNQFKAKYGQLEGPNS